ncbi:MAG: 2-C-methyl-D-erythritol 4-phosphate cytidylyltransferase [Candidatus Lindowbacteria bacterium]|nr:2-C-methyl-D-erythritol 4-phosphate cytidylyltransferase [Candidatus Lindowbacteria bacterium]
MPDSRILLVSSEEFRDESGYVGEWVQGGDKRQDSARNGVLAVDHADAVLIHDAARPFISSTLVHSLLSKLESCDAVAPGIRVTDTIKRVIDTKVVETLDRNHLFRLQTPQVIKYDVAVKAFTSLNPSQTYTDDLAVVEAMGGDVHIIEGDTANIKITHQSDITIASQLGSERPSLSQ